MRNKSVLKSIDWITLLIYFCLVLIGWLCIYSAVYNEDHSSIFDISQQYGKQLMWIVLAFALGGIVLLIDAKFFNAFAIPIYIAVMLLLIYVLMFGDTVAGSKSWIKIGSFALQPAEFAKFATALALASYLGKLNRDMSERKTQIIAYCLIGLPAALILLQNDTGSTMVFVVFLLVFYREGMSGLIMIVGVIAILLFIVTLYISHFFQTPLYVVAGLFVICSLSLFFIKRNKKNIFRVIGIFIVCSAFVLSTDFVFEKVLEQHQKNRILVLLGLTEDLKGVGYNVNQSKIAIGSGGLFGKGFLNGTQTKYNFVPEQSTDFIFCTVGEEFGFFGCLIVIALYVALFSRLIFLAEQQRSTFSRIYGYGITSILFFHFAINIGMTIGLVPVIGIPLPFLSYGGSSLFAFTLMLFVFLKQDANRLNIL